MRDLLRRGRGTPLLIGVVHLGPTPGAPRYRGDLAAVLGRAREDALALVGGGADAVVVENFGDAPFFADRVPPETVTAMTLAVREVLAAVPDRPVGVNVLRNDVRAALGICAGTGASFLRVNVHVGAALTDQGLVEGRAAETLRERARLCPGIAILADVHVKHATPLGGESIAEAAEETLHRGLADALIVSGQATGRPPRLEDLLAVRERLPDAALLVGSGLDAANARELLTVADGALVGTSLKRDGRIDQPVDRERVRRLRAEIDRP